MLIIEITFLLLVIFKLTGIISVSWLIVFIPAIFIILNIIFLAKKDEEFKNNWYNIKLYWYSWRANKTEKPQTLKLYGKKVTISVKKEECKEID